MFRDMYLIFILFFLLPLSVLAQPGAILEKDQHFSQSFQNAVVTAGEPLAAKVGAKILAGGGNAVDSATAVALALAVTLPRAGNLGGGGFALILDPDGQVHSLDFRETAPGKMHRDFYRQTGTSSRKGPTAAGVPGTVAGLWAMHQKFGVLSWAEVVKPAQLLARDGFPVTDWLHDGISSSRELLEFYPETARIFLPHREVPRVGSLFQQKALAETLTRLAHHGPQDFYEGQTARKLVQGMQKAGGVMTAEDLKSYRAVWRKPIQGHFLGYTIWSMPPPSSGGIHLIQMLQMVEHRVGTAAALNSARDLHQIVEVMRLAYCDRARFLGDPDFVEIPREKLLSEEYLEQRKQLIQDEQAGDSKALAPELFNTPKKESPDTTHFNVVDKDGMAVSFTYTLNFSYGSGFVAPETGFLLNNEMDDFNAVPGTPNAYGLIGSEANDVEAGKRPLSSMTPTIVTKDKLFFAAVGAPGGSRIINGVFQAVLNILAYGLNAQTAVAVPRVHHQWYPDHISYELGISQDTLGILSDYGHKLEPIYAVAHVLAVVRGSAGQLETGLDPRRPAHAEGY